MAALLDDDETCFWRTLPGEGEGIYVAREGVLLHPVAARAARDKITILSYLIGYGVSSAPRRQIWSQ